MGVQLNIAHKYDHLRDKAIRLRTEQHLTLEQIVERLQLPKTTVYHWIKDIPIPETDKQKARQTLAQRNGTLAMQAKFAALRENAYQQGWNEAPELLQDLAFRDFVVLYMAEGYKRGRNSVSFVNSDARMVKLAHRWIYPFTSNTVEYRLQQHVDHDENELKWYWGNLLSISPELIKTMRKSNSGQLAGRQFRSVYGLLSVRVGDTYLRARLEAWMDYIKSQW
jgi:hypothetical protein